MSDHRIECGDVVDQVADVRPLPAACLDGHRKNATTPGGLTVLVLQAAGCAQFATDNAAATIDLHNELGSCRLRHAKPLRRSLG